MNDQTFQLCTYLVSKVLQKSGPFIHTHTRTHTHTHTYIHARTHTHTHIHTHMHTHKGLNNSEINAVTIV